MYSAPVPRMHAMQLVHTGPIEPNRDALQAIELDRPKPGPGELRIRVSACAVCHTELDQIEGRVATPLPRIPGHQVVGIVDAVGTGVHSAWLEQRVGVGWIASACGQCRWCTRGQENLCPEFRATGCDIDGGYAEFMTVAADFAHPLPSELDDVQAAPMLCAGAIGLRSLRLTGLGDGQILGLTGFGASNHLVLSLARILLPRSKVMVWARDAGQREQAMKRGADWAGDTLDQPPEAPDAIIDTTPVWSTVLAALERLAPGGRLVINAIAKLPDDLQKLAELDYARQLWREKEIKSVANVTRADIRDFLDLAAKHRFKPEIQVLPLTEANRALRTIRFGGFTGAFVLNIGRID